MTRVMANPRIGPVPKTPRKAAETTVVPWVSIIVRKAFSKPASTADAADLPLRNSSRMRSNTRTFESTPMPMVRMTPAMPGSVRTAPKYRHRGEQDQQVEDQGQDGIDSCQAVINDHEDHDHDQADDRSANAVANGV